MAKKNSDLFLQTETAVQFAYLMKWCEVFLWKEHRHGNLSYESHTDVICLEMIRKHNKTMICRRIRKHWNTSCVVLADEHERTLFFSKSLCRHASTNFTVCQYTLAVILIRDIHWLA